jgi:large subunit ribosomal protein L10
MPNQENKDIVKNLKEKISKAKSITFADYLGLTAGQANDLRAKLKEADAEVVVAKNTLLKVALKDEKVETADAELKGPTAAIFAFSDPIAPIKAVYEFTKKVEFPKVKFAIIEGLFTSGSQVEIIKDLPSKEQLLGQVVGGLKSPLSGFVNVLGGVQRKFVYALNAIADKKK